MININTQADAIAEGIAGYCDAWARFLGKNHWVWVISFKTEKRG